MLEYVDLEHYSSGCYLFERRFELARFILLI